MNQSGANKIGAGAVVLAKLASSSVDSDKIVDGAIATADIRQQNKIQHCSTTASYEFI